MIVFFLLFFFLLFLEGYAMELNKETRDRIFAAAEALYEQAGRGAFPTVDAVRKAAKVNMNDASTAMREWRRMQTAKAAPVAVQVPDTVQQTGVAAVVAIWTQAQELANESLRAAQAGWEAERAELDAMRKELADAFEAQAAELDQAKARLAALEASEAAAHTQVQRLQQQLATASERATTAEARIVEIEHRAGDLRAELDHAHREQDRVAAAAEADRARLATVSQERDRLAAEAAALAAKLDTERSAHQEQRKVAAQEAHRAAERLTTARQERDASHQVAAHAREEAAALRGEVEALRRQLTSHEALLRDFSAAREAQGGKKKE